MASKNRSKLGNIAEAPPSVNIINALRRAGYRWDQAMFEIIDNSVDAIRTKKFKNDSKGEIFILAQKPSGKNFANASEGGKVSEIHIIDNGCGMNAEEVVAALTMGDSSKVSNNLTGVFGIGLKTAGMALGTSIQVTSRDEYGRKFYSSEYNPDAMLRGGNWTVSHGATGSRLTNMIEKQIGRSTGTCISIYGVDEVSTVPAKQTSLYDTLMKNVRRVYRYYLDPKSAQYLDLTIQAGSRGHAKYRAESGSHVKDYIAAGDMTTFFLGDKDCTFEEFEYEGQKFKVRLSHTKVGKGSGRSRGSGNASHVGEGWSNQYRKGWYFIRNGREIAVQTGPFWDDRSEGISMVSNFLGEIMFEDNGVDSPPVKCDFGKKGVEIDPAFKDYMHKLCKHAIAIIAEDAKHKKTETTVTQDAIKEESQNALGRAIKTKRMEAAENTDAERKTDRKPPTGRVRQRYVGSKLDSIIHKSVSGLKSEWNFHEVGGTQAEMIPQPFWSEVDKSRPGVFNIYINTTNVWVAAKFGEKKYKEVYQIAATAILCADEHVKSTEVNDYLAAFGSILSDFEDQFDTEATTTEVAQASAVA